jgi:hypothetical protein
MVQFPIESSPIESLYSLGPTQSARLRFTIKNASTKPYGVKSDLGRRITFRLFFHESELGDEHVCFFDDTGARIPLSRGFSREIPELLPGQSIVVEGIVAIAEGAPFYRAGRMWLSLELGSIADPTHPKTIQYRAFDVRVSRPFNRDELGDVLLVVNNRTEANELEAWQALFSALGLRFSVYDISLEGGFDLGESAGIRKSDLQGKSVVFLNHLMDTAKGERKSIHYASKEQLLDLCASGARVHVVGEPFHLDRFLLPTFDNAASNAIVPATSTYLVPRKDKPRHSLSVGDAPHDLEISKWSVFGFGKPTEKALIKKAEALHDRLERSYPGRRHVLVWNLEPHLVKDYFVASRWQMGRISIHRSLDGVPAAISTTTMKGSKESQRARILERDNILQFVLALPFADKLRRLEALTGTMAERDDDDDTLAGAVVGIVMHAMMIDLVEEQIELLRRPWCQGSTPQSLSKALVHLHEVVDKLYRTRKGSPEGAARAALVHILSSLHFFASSQVAFWEYVPPFLFERRAPVLRRVTLDLIKKCIVRIFGGADPKSPEERERIAAFAAEVETARKAFVSRYHKAKKNHEWAGGRASYTRDLFLAPLENANFKRCTNVLRDVKSSIVSKAQYMEGQNKDRQSAEKRRVMMKRAEKARDALLLETRCDELLARAKSAS